MSDKIELNASTSGEDGINRLVSAYERLVVVMEKMATANDPLLALQRQMAGMQASITTGFAEMAARIEAGGETMRSAQEKGAEKLLQEQLKWEAKQHAAANKFHHKQVEQQDTLLVRQLDSYVKFWEKVLAEQLKADATRAAIQQRRDTETHAQAVRAANEYVATWEKMLADRQAIQERRDVELHAARQRQYADYVGFWEKELAAQESAQARQRALAQQQQVELRRIQAGEAERHRNLNTNFLTSPLSGQLAAAERAQVYSSLGGNAVERFGSAAATADIALLRRQLELLPEATRRSRSALAGHNDVMREGHSLARGLAGSLGGLWLTYGSLVPLAAGAAIAASLKGVLQAGKDVEYQLKFVESLGGGQVNLDRMLHITDATVVSVKEAAEGLRALAQNGLAAEDSLKVLPSILNLAVIGEMSVSSAALAATGTVSAFGLKLSDLDRVANIFAQAAATSNTSVSAMTESMKQASTVAAVYGSTVEETAAALGVLAKVNIIGSAAGTAYTNMLTNLYTPTEKAKRALTELGVDAAKGNGELKNTTELMGELRVALAGFNDSARASFLGDIFTVRGQKGASTILANWDEYIKKTEEARTVTDFMGTAVAKLEDSTEGALKRLSNNISSSFNKAFADSSPALQRLVMHLGEVARSQATVDLLTGMADAALRLTTMLVDNAGAIGLVVAGLVSLRILGGVATMLGTYSAAAAVATTASTTLATRMALLNASLGYIGLALTAVAVAYELFINKTPDVEKADQRRQNSIQVNIEYLDREIERLTERNKLWNPETLQFDKQSTSTTETAVESELSQLRAKEERLAYVNQRLANMKSGDYNMVGLSSQQGQLTREIETSKRRLWELTAKEEELGVQRSLDEKRRNQESTVQAINNFMRQGEAYDKLSANYAGKDNEAYLRKTQQAKSIKDMLVANQISETDAIAKLSVLKSEASGLLAGRAPKVDKRDINDGFKAELQAVQNALKLTDDETKSHQKDLDSLYKTGQLSALDYYTQTRDLTKTHLEAQLDAFRQEEDISARREHRSADVVKFQGKQAQVAQEMAEADKARVRGLNEYIEAQQKEETKFQIDELKKRGDLKLAYELENRDKLRALDLNVTSGRKMVEDAFMGDDPAQIGVAMRYAAAANAARAAYDRTAAAIGNDEAFIKSRKSFDLLFSTMQAGLVELSEKSNTGAGLPAVFDNALASERLYASALDKLVEKQQELARIAALPGATDSQKKDAVDALKQIEVAGARVRNIWTDVGRDIEKSLSDAFGKPGKALGALINISTGYATRQKQIQADLAKSSTGASPEKLAELQKKAASDMASAQISAYGDMAGAAKGFFDEQSGGYKVLATAEKAFRVAELAMTFEAMAAKLFATSTTTAAAVGSTVPVVASEATKSSAYGITALAASLAAPFPANLVGFGVVAAMLAAIGVAVSASGGAGGTPLHEQRQAKTGTGSVLGDSKAKSDSIAKSLELVQKNTYQDLAISAGMLASLRNIESSLGGLGALVTRSFGQGTAFGDMKDSSNRLGGKLGTAGAVAAGAVGGAAAGAYFGMAAGSVGGPIGMAIGAAVGLVVGAIASALTRVKTSVTDQGIALNSGSLGSLMAHGVSGSSYADVNTKKSFIGITYSNKNDRQAENLSAELTQQFTMVVGNLRAGVLAAADALGEGGATFLSKLDAFVVQIPEISTKGLSGEEIQKALEAAFSKVGDDMAKSALGGLERFQKVGEGYFETLARIATDYQTVEVVFASFGKSFGQIGLASIDARERLIELSGGLSEFSSKADYFLKNFFGEAEQTAALKARIDPTLAQYGLSAGGADPIKQFKDYVLALDTTTEAGAQAYAILMTIAPAFKAIADSGKKLRDELIELTLTRAELLERERNALDPANRALFDQVQHQKLIAQAKDVLAEAYENESQKIQTAIDRLQSFGDGLRKFRDSLVLGNLSPLTPQQKYVEARSQFDDTLARAQAGDTDAQGNLQSSAQAFLEASRTANASSSAYTSDYQRVVAVMGQMSNWAYNEVSLAKDSLEQLKLQVGTLIDIKSGVLTVVDALKNLGAVTQGTTSDVLQKNTVTSLYEQLLGRAPEQAGMDYWLNALRNGMSTSTMADFIRNSAEYQNGHAGYAVAPPSYAVQSSGSYQVAASPYSSAAANDEVVAQLVSVTEQLENVNEQLGALRGEQKDQTGAQIGANAAVSDAMAEKIADSFEEAYRTSAWDKQNQVVLR